MVVVEDETEAIRFTEDGVTEVFVAQAKNQHHFELLMDLLIKKQMDYEAADILIEQGAIEFGFVSNGPEGALKFHKEEGRYLDTQACVRGRYT